GEAAVGDEADLLAEALAGEGGGDGEHLAHAGAAYGAFAADDDDVAGLDVAFLDRFEAGFLAVEDLGGAGDGAVLEAGGLGDGAFRGQVALEDDDVAAGVHGGVHRLDDGLGSLVDGVDLFEVVGDGLAGDGDAIAVKEACVKQGAHDGRRAADLVQVEHDV